LWVAREPETAESHRIYSVEADAAGSWDRLELTLAVAAEWQDAVSGSSTRWLCQDQDDLTFLLVVYTAQGSEVGDCRIWGADPARMAWVEGAEPCDTSLDG
jgi:hypothetical protein